MQKISQYLYSNRIELLADLATFNVEFTNVYQRPIKIYKGVDNALEFDIKNADQKRIDLINDPVIDNIKLNVIDASGFEVGVYDITPASATKGIATATIPSADLDELTPQFLRYSVTCDKGTSEILLYGDTRFSAVGTLELVGNAKGIDKTTLEPRVYDTFTAEIDLKGLPTWHSSAIPSTFYEAEKRTTLQFDVDVKGLTGNVWIEATTDTTITAESFKKGDTVYSFPNSEDETATLSSPALAIGDYKYFRVSYASQLGNGIGAAFTVTLNNNSYDVVVRAGGTGYAVGSQIKVLGSVLGGTDGVNDLVITVTGIDGSTTGNISSYSISGVSSVSWTGVAANGTSTYVVTGKNITGNVDKVEVN